MAKEYRSTWTAADVMYTDPAVLAGKWVEIGEYKVEAGVGYKPGFGFSRSQADADGRIYAKFVDDGAAEETGIFRIAAYTPDDLPIGIIFEARTESLNTSPTDRTKQIPFPAIPIALYRDFKYKFFFKSDADDVIDTSACTVLVDITKISLAG